MACLRYAASDPYGGAIDKLLPSDDMRLHPLAVEGPLEGDAGLLPELLLVRHMLWRIPGSNVVAFYRRNAPEFVERAATLPAPPEGTTLEAAWATIAK